MRQLVLDFPDDDEEPTVASMATVVPTAIELAILREFEAERLLEDSSTWEDRRAMYSKLAADERRRAVESRRSGR